MNFNVQYGLQCPNPNQPVEDAVYMEGNAAAVFDGVTLLHQSPYPNPSPAAEAATNGAQAAVHYGLSHIGENDFVFHAFEAASNAIRGVNERHGINEDTVDYLSVQYAAAVGALAVFVDDTLFYGQINDSGVMLCRPNGNIVDDLITDKAQIAKYLEDIRRKRGFAAGSREEHVFIRDKVVNVPDAKFKGRPLDDYVLTGEEVCAY